MTTDNIAKLMPDMEGGITLTPHQQSAYDTLKQFAQGKASSTMAVLTGFAGTGKEQPVSTTVQTPSGPRRFGDLAVGDQVIGRDGQANRVTGVFPQGVKKVYRVSFRDGASTTCGADHNWMVYSKKNACKGRTVTTQQLIDSGLKNSAGSKFRVPLCSPVNYKSQAVPFDPYLIGILIGDGNLTGNSVQYACGDLDEDINTHVFAGLPSDFVIRERSASGCIRVTISQPDGERKNALKEYIKHLGLNVRSAEKFIPQELLHASVADRRSLLQGLMDSDGTSRGNRIGFSSNSMQLAKDVVTLVQSLGGVAIYKCLDRTNEGKGYEYSVNVRVTFNPFKCERKAAGWQLSTKNPPARYITDIAAEGYEEQMCIMVDAEDHLYLTDNFIVTHNTTLVGKLTDELSGTKRIAVCAPTNKAVKVLREKITTGVEFATLHSLLGLRMKENDDGQMDIRREGASSIHEYDLIIVDECSMISPDLFQMILTGKRNARVLFVGDPAQLPPVGESMESPVFSMVELRAPLSEVVRQARGNPIIELSMAVRRSMAENRVMSPAEITAALPPTGEGVPACVTYGGEATATQWALAEIAAERECRIVAFTNAQVQGYNHQIHTALHGHDAWLFVPGQRLMMQQAGDAHLAGSAKPVPLHTSEELDVVNVEPGSHPRYPDIPARKLTLTREDGAQVVGYVPEHPENLQQEISQKFAEWRALNSDARAGNMEARGKAKLASQQAWGLKKAFLPLRHTYAITAHKSQGSTFDTVLVDYTNLCRMRSAYELNRALYVAITRPSQFLAVVA